MSADSQLTVLPLPHSGRSLIGWFQWRIMLWSYIRQMRAPSLTHSFRKTPRGSCFNSDWTDLWSRWEFALKTCPFLFIIFYQRFDKKRARLRGYDQQDDQFGALRFIHLHFNGKFQA